MRVLFEAMVFAVGVTLPSVALLGFGLCLRRAGQVDAAFAARASRLVFSYALPALLFSELMTSEIRYGQEAVLLAAGVVTTLILFVGAEIYARCFVSAPRDQGVFVQGVFRSNMAMMGLAFVQNAYGNAGLSSGAVYVGVVTLLFNVLSVIALSRPGVAGGHCRRSVSIGRNIVTNPLIVAIVLALVLQRLGVQLPQPVMQSFRYLANVALPLALICAGATFDFRMAFDRADVAFQASIGRLVVAPLVAVMVGLGFGLRGIPMGVLFLMCAMPVASASYVMAKVMGGNDVAAANIMGMTTFGAMFSAAIGITVLRSLGLM